MSGKFQYSANLQGSWFQKHKVFYDRREAGVRLASELSSLRDKRNILILGIPRGGIPVAKAVSEELGVPFGVLVTKKIGAPDQEELAIGALSEGGETVFDEELIERLSIGKEELEKLKGKAKEKIKSYKEKFKSRADVKNKTVILVDDGVATGATIEVAIKYLRKRKVDRIVLAIPVAPIDTSEKLEKLVDEAVILNKPKSFRAVGEFYENFPQVRDKEVLQLLEE